MVELLGIVIAALILLLGWLAWRGLCWLGRWLRLLWGGKGRRLPAMQGVRLRSSRALAKAQAARIAALTSQLDRTQRALKLALAQPAPAAPADGRFRRAKRAFAALFHPDRLRCREPELGIRVTMFQQYWQVLRGIERS